MRSHKELALTVCVFWILLFAAIVCANTAKTEIALYQIIEMDDPESQLYVDALSLDIDISEAKYIPNFADWWYFETEDYKIGRENKTGNFVYQEKYNQIANSYLEGFEPVEENSLIDNTLDLMYKIGIDNNQIRDVYVSRIVDQAEDDIGNFIGEPETVAFIVYVQREIDGYPVVGSRVKALFNADGQMMIMRSYWKEINLKPIGYGLSVEKEELEQQCKLTLQNNYPEMPITHFRGRLAYVTEEYLNNQVIYSLHYSYTYSINGFDLEPGSISSMVELN